MALGPVILEWLKNFGVPVMWKPMAFGGLIDKIRKKREFDLFIMDWRDLSFDPDYLRRFFHSSFDRPNMLNDTGYRNAEFDRLADLQVKTMDPHAIRRIVLDVQHLIMMDLPYIPLFVHHRMYGIRKDRFEGWTAREGRFDPPGPSPC